MAGGCVLVPFHTTATQPTKDTITYQRGFLSDFGSQLTCARASGISALALDGITRGAQAVVAEGRGGQVARAINHINACLIYKYVCVVLRYAFV